MCLKKKKINKNKYKLIDFKYIKPGQLFVWTIISVFILIVLILGIDTIQIIKVDGNVNLSKVLENLLANFLGLFEKSVLNTLIFSMPFSVASIFISYSAFRYSKFSQAYSLISSLSEIKVNTIRIQKLNQVLTDGRFKDSAIKKASATKEESVIKENCKIEEDTKYLEEFLDNLNRPVENKDYVIEIKIPKIPGLFLHLDIKDIKIIDNGEWNNYSKYRLIEIFNNNPEEKISSKPISSSKNKYIELTSAYYSVFNNDDEDCYLFVVKPKENSLDFFEKLYSQKATRKYFEFRIVLELGFFDNTNQVPMPDGTITINVENYDGKLRVLSNNLYNN